jgi:hypothetical protein
MLALTAALCAVCLYTQYAGAILVKGPTRVVNVRFTDNNGGEFGGAAILQNNVSFTQVC